MTASSAAAIDQAYRFVSRVPAFDKSSSDPVDTATGVAVNKTITLTNGPSVAARLCRPYPLPLFCIPPGIVAPSFCLIQRHLVDKK